MNPYFQARFIALFLLILAVAGCGGSGSSDGGSSTAGGGTTGGATTTTAGGTVAGTAFKGPFQPNSPVSIFRISGGLQGALIGSGTTGAGGTFNIRLQDGTYTGPLVFTVSGDFASETGGSDTISAANPLLGLLRTIGAGSSTSGIAVTPLTHIALRLAQGRGPITADSLRTAIDEVGNRFGIPNPDSTIPSDPTSSTGAATDPRVQYGLVLAGLVQQARTKGVSTAALLDTLANDAADGSLDGQAAQSSIPSYGPSVFTSDLAAGIDTFVASSNNRTGLTSAPATLRTNLTRAIISVGRLELPAAVGLGQTFAVTLRLTNTGANSARLNGISLTTTAAGLTVTPAPGNPVALTGNSSAVLRFTVSTAPNGTTGDAVFRVVVDASDAVSGQSAGTTRENAGTLPIRLPSSLAIGTVQGPSTASRGASLDLILPVSNTGGTTARIRGASIRFSSSAFTVTTNPANASTVEAGESLSLRFRVVIASTAPTGRATISAQVLAEDLLTGSSGVTDRAVAGSLTVLTEAALSIGSIQGTATVVQGQTVILSLPVTNGGQTAASLQSIDLSFPTTGIAVTPLAGNPATLEPGISSLFRFQVAVSSAVAGGIFNSSATVTATDASSGLSVNVNSAAAGPLTVLRPAALQIDSLALPTQVSVGQTFVATASISNSGESTADIGLILVTFSDPGVTVVGTVSNPTFISPASAGLFRLQALVSSAATPGAVQASVSVGGVDRLAGSTVTARRDNLATTTVLSRADLIPLSVLLPATLSQGQTAVATLTVQNRGQASASVSATTLVFSRTSIGAASRGTNPGSIQGNGTQIFQLDLQVGAATPSGVATVSASVTGADTLSGLPTGLTAANLGTTLIQVPAAIQVSAVAAPARLSQGQTFTATASITNSGEASLRLAAASLTFSNPDVSAAITGTFPPAALGGGQSTTVQFTGTADAGTSPGQVTAVFEASGKDANSGLTIRGSRTVALTTTIDTPASVSVKSLTVSTGIVSQGQTLSAQVVLRNSGSAAAVIDQVALDTGASALSAPVVTTPRTLAGNGGESTYSFQISVGESPVGSPTLGTQIQGTDQNSGLTLTVPQAAVRPTVTVQTRAQLRVTGLTFSRPLPARLITGESATVTMTLQNIGEAGANLSAARLLLDSPVLSAAQQNLSEFLASGQTRTIVFPVQASPVQTAVVNVNGDATATDSNSGLSTPVTRAATLTVTVLKPAELSLDAILPSQATLSLGQTIPVTVRFRNSGEATLTLTRATLVPNLTNRATAGSVTGTFTLTGGQQASLTINITGLAPGDVTLTTAMADAFEDLTGRILTLVNRVPLPPTVIVQEPAQLEVRSPLLPLTVSQGQTFRMTVPVANSGEASMTLTTGEVLFDKSGIRSRIVTLPSLPVSGNTTVLVEFDVDVDLMAPTGVAAITPSVFEAKDGNTGATLSGSIPSGVNFTVQTTPTLILQPLIKQSTASQGQAFTVTIPVQNTGQATAIIQNATLTWTGSDLISSVKPGNLNTVAGGATRNFAMTVNVASNASLAAATALATVFAIDGNSGKPVPPAVLASAAPTVIQSPAIVVIESFSAPSPVSQGQTFTATVSVRNTGGATATITDGILTFSRAGITSVLTSPVTPTFVSTGTTLGTTVLVFQCTVASTAVTGESSASVTVVANDANGDTLNITASQPNLGVTTVQTQGRLVLGLLTAPSTISRGQSIAVTLSVANTGQARADITTTFLTVAAANLNASADPMNPTSVLGGQTAAFVFQLTASAGATTGATSVGATIQGTEANTGAALIESNAVIHTITIQRGPAITIGNLINPPSRVSRGQQLFMSISVTNEPDAAKATFNLPSLSGSSPGVTSVTTPPSASQVSSGQTTTLVFLVTIDSAATLGNNFIQANVPFIDANLGTTGGLITRSGLGPLEVQQEARLSLEAIPNRTTVTQGQALSAAIAITNQSGGSGASTTGTTVTFSLSDSSFAATLTPPSATIGSGATENITLNVTTSNPGTVPGTKAVNITVSARDGNSGQATVNTVVTTTVAFTVKRPPVLTAASPGVATQLSRGQVLTPVSVDFTNSTSEGAGAKITAVTLTFLAGGSTDDGSNYTVTPPALPVTIPGGGGSQRLTFLVEVETGATLGSVSISANIVAEDDNTGGALTVASPAASLSTITESKALLHIVGPGDKLPGIFPGKATVSTEQTIPVTIEVRNFGASAARIGTTPTLILFGTSVDRTGEYTVALQSGGDAVIAGATGGSSGQGAILFNVTPLSTATEFGTISLGAVVPATSSVDGSSVATSLVPPAGVGGSFVLQRKASLLATDIQFDPSLVKGLDRASTTTPADKLASRITLQVRVNNSSGANGAALLVSAAELGLTTSGGSVSGEYEVSSISTLPTTISGNGSRILTFTVTALPTAQKFVTVSVTPKVTAKDDNTDASAAQVNGTIETWVVRDAAGIVIGQPDFATSVAAPPSADRFSSPIGITIDGTRIFVADTQNSRILSFPSLLATTATTVVGQATFNAGSVNGGTGTGAQTLNAPAAVALQTSTDKLFVADSGNNRILIYGNASILPASSASAGVVIGQADFTSNGPNRTGGVSAAGFSNPGGVVVIQNKLLVSDTGNNRVLIYDPIPTGNGASATRVIGQADMVNGLVNRGGGSPGSNTLAFPAGLGTDGTRLFIADRGNDRILIYNSVPLTDGASANRVIGQIDLFSGGTSRPTTSGTLKAPTGVSAGGDTLFVADTGNNRVTIYDNIPAISTDGKAADDLLGQGFFTQDGVNAAVTAPRDSFSLSAPSGTATTGGDEVYVVDQGNNRVLRIRVP